MRKKQQKQSRRGREERKSTGQGRAGEGAPAAAPAVILLTFASTPSCSFYHLGDVSFLFPFLKTVNDDWIPTVRYGLFFICFSCRLKRGNYNYEKRAGVGGCYSQEPRDHFSTSIFSSTWRTDRFTSIKTLQLFTLKCP